MPNGIENKNLHTVFMAEIKCTSLTGQFIWSFRFHRSHSVTNVKKKSKINVLFLCSC